MSKKNKVMLAIALVAVVMLVGSGVARCTMNSEAAPDDAQASTEQAEEATEMPSSFASEEVDVEADGTGIEALIGTSWVGTEDPSSTLSIVKGAFVESKDGQNTVTYWTIDDEQVGTDEITATVLASKSMTDAASPCLVSIAQEGGDVVIKSDVLACSYRQVTEGARTLNFSGITSKLADSMGVDASKIEAAVSARAAAVSPSAKRAIWDAEVWIDYANDVATTSFTLEDGASTIISVTRGADGTIEAL